MEKSSTKTWQRVVIWVIAGVLTFGTLGFYFLIIMQQNNQADQAAQLNEALQSQQQELEMDPTAYIVNGDVTELKIEDLVVGTGEEAKEGSFVKVNYKGTLAQTGQKFDSSYDRGEPIEFSLGEVVEGWQKGMPGMKVGGKRRLVIPSEMAYGASEIPGIPANSDLVFEIELLEVKAAQ